MNDYLQVSIHSNNYDVWLIWMAYIWMSETFKHKKIKIFNWINLNTF